MAEHQRNVSTRRISTLVPSASNYLLKQRLRSNGRESMKVVQAVDRLRYAG